MNSYDFQGEIQERLKEMSRKEIAFFAWLCAVKALPFIIVKDNFNYWKKDRKKCLYTLFHTLDLCIHFYNNSAATYAYAATENAAYDAILVGDDAAHTARDIDDRANNAFIRACNAGTTAADNKAATAAYDATRYAVSRAHSYAHATYTVGYAAFAAAAKDAASAVHNAAIAATYAATAAICVADAATYLTFITTTDEVTDGVTVIMQEILLKDLEDIQNGSKISNNCLNNSNLNMLWYSKIWNNFQITLREENCSYWGDLYKDIFYNFFEVDKDALERRINVPSDIQKQGAVIVANYLEKFGKR